MENKFYIDDFERFLKDKVDDFKMYPSRRVWHSIYNNMHPGSRWPSISMCITLICTLFLIGFLNTGTTKRAGRQQVVSAIKEVPAAPALADQTNNLNSIANTQSLSTTETKQGNVNTNQATQKRLAVNQPNIIINHPADVVELTSIKSGSPSFTGNEVIIASATAEQLKEPNENVAAFNNNEDVSAVTIKNDFNSTNREAAVAIQKNIANVSPLENYATLNAASSISAVNISSPLNNLTDKASSTMQLSETDKSWIENYAMYNRPAPKKWKGKLSMQLYFTPSVVYRELKNTTGKSASNLLTSTINSSDIEGFVHHTPSFGFETGTALVYDLFKNVRIKGGLQLNYTRYNVHAFNNYHPSLTSITMNNDIGMSYATYRSSTYSNFYGVDAVKLHSQTYQFSIPLGIDLRLASIDNNIDWYAGATVQPSFIFGGKSYLLSSDTRNYVPTTEFMNRFNLNTGIETFLSVKTKSGYTWNIGPEFRRQVFSNNKMYSIQERLVSYGIKLGISKKL